MYNGAFTPAPSRIMTVAGNNGMPNIGNQQPTVRAIYDSVDLSTVTGANPFFQNVSTKTFPFANIQRNTLTAGQALSVQQFYFFVMTVVPATGVITDIKTLNEETALKPLVKMDMTMIVAGQEIMKQYPISGSVGPFNLHGAFSTGAESVAAGTAINDFRETAVKILPAQAVIPANVEFTCNVQIPPFTAPAAGTKYLFLVLEGYGTLNTPNGAI
jgi:hypothetical protein